MRRVLFSLALILMAVLIQPSNAFRGPVAENAPDSVEADKEYPEVEQFMAICREVEDSLNQLAARDNVIDEAFNHRGARYRLGAKGPKAFDCSGFTSYVFGKMKLNIGCSSRDQYARNKPVKRGDLRKGDLVFFTSPRSGRGVGHVGIVVDVDRKRGTFSFIHASTSQGVRVNESTDGYYARRYVGARRVLPAS